MSEEDMEDNGGFIISLGADGKAKLHKPEDYVEMHKDDAELIKDFVAANQELFNNFVKNRTKKDTNE